MTVRSILVVAALASFIAVPAAAKPASESPTFKHDNPSSCMGAARGGLNSNGGVREHGLFGIAQEEFEAMFEEGFTWEGVTYYDYGQFLQDWKEVNCAS